MMKAGSGTGTGSAAKDLTGVDRAFLNEESR